jgi:N-acetylmuramoyl-L-alanine amidase
MLKFNVLIIGLFISFSTHSQTVLLDPGHGGKDCGAKTYIKLKGKKKAKKICEKDLALKITKKIKDYLPKHYKVYLTRTIDSDVTLHKRSELADKIKADIFVSVHLNGSKSKASHGFETFYLDNHNDMAIKKIEEVENAQLLKEDTTINQILIDLIIAKTAPQSKILAGFVHKSIGRSIRKKFKLTDRGVKKALFYVLALSKRPAILLEAGFMTHNKEKWIMRDKKFQNAYAKAVARGIVQYFKSKTPPPIF